MENRIDFKVSGRLALFTDPLTRMGGEKCSYHLPTYEALKGIAKSVFWKPTFLWYIDRVRVMNKIRTQSKAVKPLDYGGGNSLSIYTYLAEVEYQVQAHFEWNVHYPELEHDRIDGKHFSMARRMVEKGGRRDIFLGTRECQAYVEPCEFGEGVGFYDSDDDELSYGLMFHGFDYPDEIGENKLYTRFQEVSMKNGIVEFHRPEDCTVRRFVREMTAHKPALHRPVSEDWAEEEVRA
jgi:CRISPR-associated protein Cas5d